MSTAAEERPTIASIVSGWLAEGAPPEVLIARLTEREDTLADRLRVAGTQFGLFPAIVAEVLCDIGLGTPPDPETRDHIHRQFLAQMEELRRMIEGQQ